MMSKGFISIFKLNSRIYSRGLFTYLRVCSFMFNSTITSQGRPKICSRQLRKDNL